MASLIAERRSRRLATMVLWTLAAFNSCLLAAPPNVLLIVSDDQGYSDLGSLKRRPVNTPTLDRLAREGVTATNFYVTWPACTPSRGSILTGRYPQRNGLYDMVRNDMVNYGHRYRWDEYAVSPEMTLGLDGREKTIGDLLRAAGYKTGVVGKWDMGQAKRYLPIQRGFDFFYGHGNNGIDYYTHERYGVPSMFAGNERTTADKGVYATELFRREAIRFVKANQGNPWFLYLCFNAPHGASSFASDNPGEKKGAGVQAPDEYVKPYLSAGIRDRLARYYGAVTCMDDAIGSLLAVLREQGVEKNTLILFLSDNGGAGDNQPLRGKKGSLWEGGLRSPFIAYWPERLPAQRTTHELLTGLEILPTILAAASVAAPAEIKLDGYDMLATLRGEKPSERTAMFWQQRSDKAARVGHLKWIESSKGSGLFDLASDLGETKDLSSERPDDVARIRAQFAAWRSEMDAAEPRGPFRDY